MLRNRGQALIEEELQAIVVGADDEGAPPEIGAPVAHSLHQADQLALVRRQLEVAASKRPAEEGEGSRALVENGAEPHAGRIAVDDEGPVEVRHLEDRACGQSALERLEGRGSLGVPCERVAPQEPGEGRRDDAEIPDELPVVPGEPQETAEAPGGPRHRPGRHGLHLVGVHGDAVGRDHVPEVGD
ncbi:hypothetical protein BS78_05G192500 [Paspalum vaginatum]|nr:hypothetical protein BS78_05G192500 [Paspalum vaginatum]